MIRIRTVRVRLVGRTAASADAGFSIVEALVAVVIFMIISVGVAQAMVNAIRLSGDGQHRSVALNLAATEIDYQKARNDPYSISSTPTGSPTTTTLDGITYSLTRSVRWVNVSGNEISCSVASGNFQLLRVRIRVDWGGRMPGSNPVQTTTTISPKNTILSPTTATLFIGVQRSDGTPYVGAQVKVISGSTGQQISVPVTNSDGCSYLSGVAAGNYTVTVTDSNGISDSQTVIAASKTTPTVVTAGSAVSVPFNYDTPATESLTYGPALTIKPSDLITTYGATSQDPYVVSGTPTSIKLYPVASGYSVVAGKLLPAVPAGTTPYAGCLSPDPANWAAGKVGATNLKAGVDPANATASPGTTSSYQVPMGTANVVTGSGGYVRITSSPATAQGDPGCANISGAPAQTFTYQIPVLGTWSLALPYGAWKSTFSTTSNGTFSPINMTPTSNAYSGGAATTFTIDPRTT